jgi:hypothetical protein
MNDQVKIIQIDIAEGTQWGDANTNKFIRQICIPSVQRYCQKYGYEYQLITESKYEKEIGKFDFLATKLKHYSFERYFHFHNPDKATIYIDNDIYIFNESDPLPPIKGLMNVREPEGNSSKIFREVNNLPPHIPYYNSGVTFCDSSISEHLSNYMLERLKKQKRAKGKNTDNMMLNEYLIENEIDFNELGCEWNYMPFLPNSEKTTKPNFFHFVGTEGKKLITFINTKKIDIENLTSKIVFK